LQDNGAAYEAGGLEVGQLILEVDGQKVEGKASRVQILLESTDERHMLGLQRRQSDEFDLAI